MDTQTIERLAEIMGQHDLSELEVEEQGLHIRLHRAMQPKRYAAMSAEDDAREQGAEGCDAALRPCGDAVGDAECDVEKDAGTVSITSPLVGTYYASGSPDAEPFVREGSRVTVGMTVCIIEAMKVMNEVKAESSGVITRVLCPNKSQVEYGTVLFEMKAE